MVKETPAARKSKVDEASRSKDDLNGPRRSTRDVASKNKISSGDLKTRKSERLVKQTPTKPPVGKKPGIAQKVTPSPMRRSERGKKFQPSSSSGSRKSEKSSCSTDLKSGSNRKEKSIKELTTRANKVKQLGQHDSKTECKKKKRMDARTYRTMLKVLMKKVRASDATKVRRLLEYSPVNSSSTCVDGPDESQDEKKRWTYDNENGLMDGYVGRSSDADVKGLKSDLKTSVSETLKSEDGGESFDSTLKDNLTKSSDIDLKRSNSDVREKSTCGMLKVEDDAGSSCSAKDDSMEDAACVDGCALQASDDGNLSLPCTSGDEGKRNLNNGESIQVDLFTTEKHQGEYVHIGTVQNSDEHLAPDSNLGRIASNRKRDSMIVDSGDGANKDISSSTPDVIPSDCSHQACYAGYKKQRVDDNSSVWPRSCSNHEFLQVLCQDTVRTDREDSEVCNTMLLTSKCDLKLQQKDYLSKYSHHNTCVVCKLAGELFRCAGKGCQRSYHPLCLDPPLEDVYPGVWHCPLCVKKKIEFGVHATSEGIESIWGVREVEVLSNAGVEKQKQYFVKYKGLAHAHNLWIPESKLLHEAPQLVLEYDQEKEVTEWKPEWALPHHLLKKWLFDENVCEDVADNSNGQHEWLVKWCCLDYDNATWELEDASFFKTPEGQRAITDYEMRYNKIKEMSTGECPKIPASGSSAADSNYLIYVTKLRDYWRGGHNCFIINEQDQVAKIAYFILFMQPDVSRPFLIITPYSLSSWEVEFLRLAPSINVVVYSGSSETRKGIRKLEVQEGCCSMFHVLLSAPAAISEDLEALNCIEWEAIVIEECQHSEIAAHSVDIKKLAADWRVLLTNRAVKDIAPDYINILSLLNPGGDADTLEDTNADTNHTISMLKESLSRCTLSGCKPQPSRFAEYWVPVHLSNLQLEQYSSILLSNSTSLRSCLKNDLVGALREILVSTLKCCNHPYVLEPSLQPALTKGCTLDDLYDIGGKASGKLQLLDAILSELKIRGLRFLILYQPIGGVGRDNIGDILEDYLQYRFGTDSYERIDGCRSRNSTKQAACNNFNTLKARFIFLLESRACLPSIKLSSVDAVIIFNSEWNPLNDLRALQKITIDSNSEQINVFRLYSFRTIEENILVLAKNGGNPQSISHTTSHMLLMFGASYLLSKLDEFHHDSDPDVTASIVSKDSFMKDVLQELFSVTENHGKEASVKFIAKVQQDGGKYLKSTSLHGEFKDQQAVEELPHVFWAKMLDKRKPRWKYLSTSSQRNRKRVQYFDSSPNQDTHNDENPRKRKKVGGNNGDSSLFKDEADAGRGFLTVKGKGNSGTATNDLSEFALEPVMGNGLPANHQVQTVESEGKRKLRHEQRQFLQLLKPEILKLCEVLQLPEDVSKLAELFLEYVINNHRVSKEPESILQAFQICVCWTAASLLGEKIDHKESLVHAREHLKLNCKEDEAELIFSKMQSLKRVFLLQSGEVRSLYPKYPSSDPNGHRGEALGANAKEAAVCNLEKISVKVEEVSSDPGCSNRPTCSPRKTVDAPQEEILKKVEKIQKKCRKHVVRLKEKQIRELEELHQLWVEEKTKLKNFNKVESMLIHSIYSDISIRNDKLKDLAIAYAKKRQEVEHDMTSRLKDLQARHQVEKNEEQQKTNCGLEEVKSWVQEQFLDKLPSLVSRGIREELHVTKQIRMPEGSKYADSVSGHLVDRLRTDRVASGDPGHHLEASETSELVKSKVDFLASETTVFAADEHACSDDGTTRDDPAERQISGGVLSDTPSAVPSMCGLPSMPATQVLPSLPMDEAIPGRSLLDMLVEQHDAASEEAMVGTDPKEGFSLDFETEQDARQIDTGTSNRSFAPEINHHVLASSLACGEPTVIQPSVADTSMMQPQGSGIQSCEPSEVLPAQAEAISDTHNILPEGDVSFAHHISGSHHEAVDNSPTINTESTSVSPFLSNQQIILSSEIHGNQWRECNTSQQTILSSTVQNQYTADHLNVAPCSLSESAGPPTGADPVRSEISLAAARSTQSPHLPSPMALDPLQNEYDRICREKDLVIKTHDEMMLRMVSDCDKEIEEVVAQIRRKYDTMRQEAELSFLLKKKEFDMNQNKVLMNKSLAEAFRSKCLDCRVSSGRQQAAASRNARQLLQLHRPAASRPTSSAFSGSPAVNGATAAPSGRVVDLLPITPQSDPIRPPQTRPPLISSVSSPAAGSLRQVMGELRAPAPHLHPFRPAMPLPSRGLSTPAPGVSVTLSQQPTSSAAPFASSGSAAPQFSPLRPSPTHLHYTRPWLTTTLASSILPVSSPPPPAQFPSSTPPPPHPAASAQIPVRPPSQPPPPRQALVFNQAESAGRLDALDDSYCSVYELLGDVSMQSTGVINPASTSLPSLLDQAQRLLSDESGTSGNVVQPPNSPLISAALGGVIHLSDDDEE
ncbi:hypothetical protein Dimus_019519 [Dionaea muscipula]